MIALAVIVGGVGGAIVGGWAGVAAAFVWGDLEPPGSGIGFVVGGAAVGGLAGAALAAELVA